MKASHHHLVITELVYIYMIMLIKPVEKKWSPQEEKGSMVIMSLYGARFSLDLYKQTHVFLQCLLLLLPNTSIHADVNTFY